MNDLDERAAVAAGWHDGPFIQMFLGWLTAKLIAAAPIESISLQWMSDQFREFEAEMAKR